MLELLTQSSGPLRALLDFVFPSLCSGCGKYDDSKHGLCENCQSESTTFQDPICLNCEHKMNGNVDCNCSDDNRFPLISLGDYAGSLRNAIVSFKYQGVIKLCPWVAEEIVATFSGDISALEADCLIPIPLHPSREYLRGYNQSLRFAEELAKRVHLPIDNSTLVRTKRGRPQAKLKTVSARRSNIAGVFSVSEITKANTKVILVDDVVTTGLTVMEARKTLELAGYEVVGVISMAHHTILSEPPKRRAVSS